MPINCRLLYNFLEYQNMLNKDNSYPLKGYEKLLVVKDTLAFMELVEDSIIRKKILLDASLYDNHLPIHDLQKLAKYYWKFKSHSVQFAVILLVCRRLAQADYESEIDSHITLLYDLLLLSLNNKEFSKVAKCLKNIYSHINYSSDNTKIVTGKLFDYLFDRRDDDAIYVIIRYLFRTGQIADYKSRLMSLVRKRDSSGKSFALSVVLEENIEVKINYFEKAIKSAAKGEDLFGELYRNFNFHKEYLRFAFEDLENITIYKDIALDVISRYKVTDIKYIYFCKCLVHLSGSDFSSINFDVKKYKKALLRESIYSEVNLFESISKI